MAKLNSTLIARGVTKEYIDKNTLSAYIRPGYQNILEAFRNFDINNTRVIIIGRDPYAEIQLTTGNAFSCTRGYKSMLFDKGIYEALKKSGFVDQPPDDGNLDNYTHQGVLLLNKYLTRCTEIASDEKGIYVNGNGAENNNNIHKFWKEFTVPLLTYITSSNLYTNHKIPVLLWGQEAQKLERFVGPNGVVLKWGHPSPKNTKADSTDSFKYCDNFTKVNEILQSQGLEPINWDPAFEPEHKLVNQFYTAKSMGMDVQQLAMRLVDEKRIYNDMSDSVENMFIKNYINRKPDHPVSPSISVHVSTETPETQPETQPETPETQPETPETQPETPETQPEISPETPREETGVREEVNDSIVVFTDGSCKGNGRAGATGGIGVYFPAAFNYISNGFITDDEDLIHTYIKGPVPTTMLKFAKDRKLEETDVPAKCTNQRAELLAAVVAFERILEKLKKTSARIKKPILLITDSEYVIKLVTYLLWKYLDENPKLTDVANRDLLILLYHSLSAIYRIYTGIEKDTPMQKRAVLIGETTAKKWQAYAGKPNAVTPPTYDPEWKGISVVHVAAHKVGNDLPKVSYGDCADELLLEFRGGNSEADRLSNEGRDATGIAETTVPYE
jgi:uracil-DNA glycosylase